jgi:hypothetical protein
MGASRRAALPPVAVIGAVLVVPTVPMGTAVAAVEAGGRSVRKGGSRVEEQELVMLELLVERRQALIQS